MQLEKDAPATTRRNLRNSRAARGPGPRPTESFMSFLHSTGFLLLFHAAMAMTPILVAWSTLTRSVSSCLHFLGIVPLPGDWPNRFPGSPKTVEGSACRYRGGRPRELIPGDRASMDGELDLDGSAIRRSQAIGLPHPKISAGVGAIVLRL